MEYPIGAVVVRVGSSHHANHRQVLAVSSGDGVQDAESAHGEGDHARPHALRTRVAVGGVAGVELVAATHEVELRLGDEVVQERQVEVAGDGEDVPHADLHEPPSQVATQRAIEGGSRAGLSRRADLSGTFHVTRLVSVTVTVTVTVEQARGFMKGFLKPCALCLLDRKNIVPLSFFFHIYV
ncbi:hypothetical protein CR513_06800, partial [Mucuna pruriens]